jgi:hypothetical protein
VPIDKTFLFNALLCHNYLPTQRRAKEELPPIFSTESFTPPTAMQLVSLQDIRRPPYSGFDQVDYKLTRFNGISRILSLPHPLPHAKLCYELSESLDNFSNIFENPNSQIGLRKYTDGRIVVMSGYGDVDVVEEEVTELDFVKKINHHLVESFGKRYRVRTDIANCFPSIYSHSVPWALVGHATAKARRDNNLWFNKIDKHLRSCKRDETQGIAIGPGASTLIAEIILSKIDFALKEKGFEFTRYIDDFTGFCETEEHAWEFVRTIESAAAKYKLQLNIKKTEIVKLPSPMSEPWVIALEHRTPVENELKASRIFDYLDFAVDLANQYPDGSVLKFAAGVVVDSQRNIALIDVHKVLDYLLNLAFHQPSLLPSVATLIERYEAILILADRERIEIFLNTIILENIKKLRSDGVCWGIYCLIKWGAGISQELAHRIIETQDAFSIWVLYWTEQHRDLVKIFCEQLDNSDLYLLDKYWILIYQLFYDDIFHNPYQDGVFEILKSNGVNFLLPRN